MASLFSLKRDKIEMTDAVPIRSTEHSIAESPIISETVSDKVYRWIKNSIINGDLKPGERIIQENLTKQLNVSRTPIRDALQRLSAEKLVVLTPFHGAEVFALSKKSLDEIYEVRLIMESYAAQKACDLITDDIFAELHSINEQIAQNSTSIPVCMDLDRRFHCLVCMTAGSDYIMEVLTSVWDKSDPYKSIFYTLPGSIIRAVDEHQAMLINLRSGDKNALAEAVRAHLHDVINTIHLLSGAFKAQDAPY